MHHTTRTRAPLLPVAISQSPLLSGTLPADLFYNLAKPLPIITIGPCDLGADRPPVQSGARWPTSSSSSPAPSSSSLSSTLSSPAPISPKDVISLLNLLEAMDNDVATEVQRVRLGIQETRTLVRECREESKARASELQKRREQEQNDTKGADDDFWLGM